MTRAARVVGLLVVGGLVVFAPVLRAHSGPPFPIVSDRVVGRYSVSVWTDPDSTDDRTVAGKFWVVIEATGGGTVPAGTQATVAIRALDRQAALETGRAAPVDGLQSRQFVALLMDHEGPFSVHVTIDGPLGRAEVETRVDATYDLRPAPALLAVFLFPFVAVGALWVKVLLRRRRRPPPASPANAGAEPQAVLDDLTTSRNS